MPVHISWRDLQDSGSDGILNEIADNAADYACHLYKNYPGAILPDPTGFGGFLKGFWDDLCSPRPPGLPPPPVPPFVGGQCKCMVYTVTVESFNSDGQSIGTNYTDFYGEIAGCGVQEQSPGVYGTYVLCRGLGFGGRPCLSELTRTFIASGGSASYRASAKIISVVAVGGKVDNCGDLPPSYPLTQIPPDQFSYTYNHSYNDGTDISIPIVLAPFSLSPNFNFNAGGFDFNINLGGVDVSSPGESDPLVNIENFVNNTNEVVNNTNQNIVNLGLTLGDISNTINNELNVLNPVSDPTLVSGQGTEKEDVDDLRWLVVDLIKLPDKAQFGKGAPNVYFAGWLEFAVGDYYTLREQINFQKSIFLAPKGASGYAVTFTNGAEGAVTWYKKGNEGEG